MSRIWGPAEPAAPSCPVCHARGPIAALLVDSGHVLHRCPACRACFYADRTMPDYELEEETGFYQQLYLEQNGSIHHVTRFLFVVDDEAIDSVLDVGCGFGFGVDMARRALGWRAVGIDPSHYAREGAALLGADIRKDYLSADTELGAPFGLVVASEVIEHVPDPDGFLRTLRRWLRPGATLVMTTPDADAIAPGAGEAELVSILAVGTHLTLFSARSLELALRRAGFAHVEVEARHNNLLALACDRPIRRRADAEARHVQAYQTYLTQLLDTAEPGTALWNGAAGRLFALQAGSMPLEHLHGLFARIAAAWQERFGIDLLRLRLPETSPEQAIVDAERSGAGKAFMWPLGARQPMNLATVLFCRALLETRRPGRLPEDVLRWARPAYVHAVHTARVLMGGTMIDLDLRMTAWRARLMIVDCLAELAPEMEGELLAGLAQPSPGGLRERIDPAPEMLAARIAPYLTRMVQANRFDEARRVEPWLRDLDLLVRATAHDPVGMYYALFTLGVLRLVGEGRTEDAAAVFGRLVAEAEARAGDAQADRFRAVGVEHVAMARRWGGRGGAKAPALPSAPTRKERRKRVGAM